MFQLIWRKLSLSEDFYLLMCFPIHALYSRVLMLYKDQLVRARTP
uniref:Uncharacterized protein n=1 Tax=Anguilla anguilla TaxID=7936 RepID=A0A0E9T158_ANGAN